MQRKKKKPNDKEHPSPYCYSLPTLNHSGFREVGRAAGGEDGVKKTHLATGTESGHGWLAAELVFSRVPLCAFAQMIPRLRPPFCEELQRKECTG